MEKIKIMLVDDHDVVRTGLKTFIQTQEGLEVVAEANSGESALQVLSETTPDLVVMDITMPEYGWVRGDPADESPLSAMQNPGSDRA